MKEGCFFLFEYNAWGKVFFVLFETPMHIELLTLYSIPLYSAHADFYFSFFPFIPELHHLWKSISKHFMIVFSFCCLGNNNSKNLFQVISTSYTLKLVVNIFWRLSM